MRKTRSRFMPIVVLPLLGLLFLAGCGTTRIFHADFNADMIGNRPNPSPPTAPTGDEIWMPDREVPGHLEVVNSADLASRALRYRNIPVAAGSGFLGFFGFVSTPVSPASTHELWATWDGVPNLTEGDSPLDIWFGDVHAQPTALLRFKDGKISVRTQGEGQAFEEIGTFTNGRVHSIILSANKANQTYSLSILERNSPAINLGPRPVLGPAAFNSNRPALVLWYNGEASGSGTYVIDNVQIRRKD